ncbi:MAG: glycine cleavage system protein GcvH [Chloroflexota bacterium]|jgi:glycine cleavage system H protein
MSDIPEGFLFTKEDEWLKVEDGEGTVGITDYAQDALSDIVYIELPDVGESVKAGEAFGVVESVKAASDLYSPVSGEVTAVNEEILDAPETVNTDPYDGGWMVKIKLSDASELDGLMDTEAYTAYCEERE